MKNNSTKKKKVSIFTIYVENFGAVLQAYALQKHLNSCDNVEVAEIVDFYTNEPYNILRKKTGGGLLKSIYKKFFVILRYYPMSLRYKREKKFINEEVRLSRRYHSVDELMRNIPVCDIFLTGSDQVFNLNARYKKIFYQEFPKENAIKAAYASSFGISDFTAEFENKVSDSLLDFDFLSCREQQGADFMTKITGMECPRVVDPTLLLTKEEWSRIAVKPKIKDKYIFIYDLNGGQNLIDIAIKVNKNTGFKIVCLTRHPHIFYKDIDKQIYSSGPREFVGWFQSAEYVITDSFHGTMFSLIFERPFNAFIAVKHSFSRITSILDRIGLSDRIVEDAKKYSFANQNEFHLRYKQPMEELIEVSKQYLRNVITH